MKIESFKDIFQQKNIKLLTREVMHSVNKIYKSEFKLNVIKGYGLSTVFVDKLLKNVDKYKTMLVSLHFEEKLLS
jgi:hypothetical protein